MTKSTNYRTDNKIRRTIQCETRGINALFKRGSSFNPLMILAIFIIFTYYSVCVCVNIETVVSVIVCLLRFNFSASDS